jgi:hypothetical protein
MIVEDERVGDFDDLFLNINMAPPQDNTLNDKRHEYDLESFMQRFPAIHNRIAPHELKQDLIKHLWQHHGSQEFNE